MPAAHQNTRGFKPTGLLWVKEIPADWKVLPNIALFADRIERGYNDNDLLSVTIERGVIRQNELLVKKDSSNEDKSAYKRVRINDIVYNKMRMWQGAAGVSAFEGIVSPAYIVLNPKVDLNTKYFHYLFRTDAYTKESYRSSYGICDDQLSLRYKDFKRMYAIVPPRDEQDAIVEFIERKTVQIDRFIANKKRLIELLKEKKAAIINRAVTKGINPDAPMKPSGIEWLGDIPEHWELRKVKHVTRILRGKFTHRPRNDPEMYDGEYPFIQTGDVARADKYITEYSQTLNEKGLSVSKMFPKGTLVMTIAANVGDMAILDFEACFPDSIVGFVPAKGVQIDFLFHVLTSMKPEVMRIAPINTQHNMNVNRVGSMWMCLPEKGEQITILKHIVDQTKQIEQTIGTASRELSLIEEYKSALIARAVIGELRCSKN